MPRTLSRCRSGAASCTYTRAAMSPSLSFARKQKGQRCWIRRLIGMKINSLSRKRSDSREYVHSCFPFYLYFGRRKSNRDRIRQHSADAACKPFSFTNTSAVRGFRTASVSERKKKSSVGVYSEECAANFNSVGQLSAKRLGFHSFTLTFVSLVLFSVYFFSLGFFFSFLLLRVSFPSPRHFLYLVSGACLGFIDET